MINEIKIENTLKAIQPLLLNKRPKRQDTIKEQKQQYIVNKYIKLIIVTITFIINND